MSYMTDELMIEGSVAQARQAFQSLLARWGLDDISHNELESARKALEARNVPATTNDIQFQASLARLQARKDMSAVRLEAALSELMVAEYDCDQAEWERDCHRAASMAHCKSPQIPLRPMPMPDPEAMA